MTIYDETFLEERKSGIGGTDAPVILGESPWKTRAELWAEKLGMLEPQESNKDMKRGIALEDIARSEYEEATQSIVYQKPMLRSKKNPYMIAHIDGHRWDLNGRGNVLVEIKCPRSFVFRKLMKEGIPTYYLLQIQHYLEVMEFDEADFVGFNSDSWDLLIIPVKRDREIGEILMREEGEFWESVQTKQKPQEITKKIDLALPKVQTDCRKLNIDELAIAERNQWRERLREYKTTVDQLAMLEDLKDKQKEELISMMGGYEVVQGLNVALYNTMVQAQKRFDEAVFRETYPEINLEKFKVRGEPSRRFRPFFLKGGIDYD